MLHGLGKLTWIEIKVFLREPMGAFGTIGIPVLLYVVLGHILGTKQASPAFAAAGYSAVHLPVLVALFICINTVLSVVNIVCIYREGGILKRLRATPLRPQTILSAHVIVKLLFTAATLVLMFLAGKRYSTLDAPVHFLSFTLALLISTLSILSIGFLIASIVPTARFAQPIGAVILYPLVGISGLFVPLALFPPVLRAVARCNPFTYAVSLLQGIWVGDSWLAHSGDLAALTLVFVLCTALSARVFRWE
jgi:ABC-2 type transport system permease protein